MAIKQLQKSTKTHVTEVKKSDTNINKFIAQGGSLATNIKDANDDHRLTLRIPCWLMDKIDLKRKERIGSISRNLFILETLDKAMKE